MYADTVFESDAYRSSVERTRKSTSEAIGDEVEDNEGMWDALMLIQEHGTGLF